MRILLVEDDCVSREYLRTLVAKYGECDMAVHGEEAVSLFEAALEENRPYDVIFLDIMMPQLDGHQTLQTIRQVEAARNINGLERVKVIMTTSLNDAQNVVSAFFRDGCESYLVKPFSPEQVKKELRKLGLIPE